jgi:hypothetical protein
MGNPDSKRNPYAAIAPGTMGALQFRLQRGLPVEVTHLAEAIRRHGGKQLPPEVAEHVAERLLGRIKKPRGRKSGGLRLLFRNALIETLYPRYLAWLQRHQERHGGFPEWRCVQRQPWWTGPAHERAARMTVFRVCGRHPSGYGLPGVDWREVQNIVSSGK